MRLPLEYLTGNKSLLTLAALLVAACSGGDAGDGGLSGGADAGAGGNVGFGGAQDIGQFRDILDQGGIPGESTLDAAGFFSEHWSEQPPPDCGGMLCAHGMLSVGSDWITGAYQSVLQVSMNTPIDPATLERKPLDLVLVVDVSGSMVEDDRIGYVRQGLHLLVDELDDGDRVALVTYSDLAAIRSELGPLDRAAMHGRIDELVARGSTNIYAGLDLGFRLATESQDWERQHRVMLLSDGVATAGILDDRSIIGMAESYIADGVGLTTIGVGNDFNVGLMRGLAERGAGNFYYLESPTAIAEVFGEELDYFVAPLALDVTVAVTAMKSYSLGNVVGTRLWQAAGSTGSIYLPAVFIASRVSDEPTEPGEPGEPGRRGGGGSLFVDMTPLVGAAADVNRVAEVRLSYRLPGESQVRESRVVVDNPFAPGELPEAAPWLSHEAMAEHHAMYNVFLGLHRATYLAAFDYGCALATVERLGVQTRAWNLERRDPDLEADLILIDRFAANLRETGALADMDAATCQPPDGYDDGYDDYDGRYGDDYPHYHHCSAGGGSSGAAGAVLIGLAALMSRRRRRRAR